MAMVRESQIPLKVDRTPMEFSDQTKLDALRRADFKCECCGRSKPDLKRDGDKAYFEIHHILPIFIIAREFPELSLTVIKSVENAKVLCIPCHHKTHHEGTMKEYIDHAEILLRAQEKTQRIAQLLGSGGRRRI